MHAQIAGTVDMLLMFSKGLPISEVPMKLSKPIGRLAYRFISIIIPLQEQGIYPQAIPATAHASSDSNTR